MSKRMIDSELIEALGTDIRFDGTGNVIVGKNLEVNGTTKLNGGIKPIHTYSTPVIDGQSYDIDVYIEKYNSQSDTHSFMGILRYRNPVYDNSSYLVIGSYGFSYDPSKEGMISDLYACGYEDFRVNDNGNGKLLEFKYSEALNYLGSTSYLTKATGQAKLYRHVLNLSNSNNMYSGYIVYISTSNLKVASLEDLTTLLRPSENYIYPLTGTCTGLDTRDAIQFGSKNLYIKSFNKISYENNTWYFKDNYGDKETFDGVSDTVTAV